MHLKISKPSTEAEKSTGTTLDTIEVSADLLKSWKLPPFQREIRHNDKLRQIAFQIKEDDGVIPGVITIGVLSGVRYIVDGQHRREAFLLSECVVGYVDVRVLHFANMAEMGEEFVRLNTPIAKMRPDDILRGLEGVYDSLRLIRKSCPFVGYDYIRRNEKAPVLSMSTAIRCWVGSANEVPRAGGTSVVQMATFLTGEEADEMVQFLNCAIKAWGRDASTQRLWVGLNLILSMWLYRRLVVSPYTPGKTPQLTREQFTKCLMSVSAKTDYVDWLLGRILSTRELSPAYNRIKQIFAERLIHELGLRKKPNLPAPAWASSAMRR